MVSKKTPEKGNKPTAKSPATKAKKLIATKAPIAVSKARAPKKPKDKPVAVLTREVGRPTAYRPEFCQMMRDFFIIEVTREVEVVMGEKTETRHLTNTFPTLTRFATKIGVSRDTLYEWASKKDEKGNLVHPEFSDALTCAQDMQETLMIEGGLSGHYESKFLTFLAPNISRLKNKVETVMDVSMNLTNTEKLDSIYEEQRKKIEELRGQTVGRAERLGLNDK